MLVSLYSKLREKFNEFTYECLKICLIYQALGFSWVYFSDKIAYATVKNQQMLLVINTYKGWIYVFITSVILFLLINSLLKKVEESKKENRYLSYYDVLTDLYNRRFYEEEIKRLDVEKNLPISIIMADVNGLKLVNDAFGHQLGDQFLQKAAEAIKKACRDSDILARWGGDEFVILLPNTRYAEAEEIVNRIKSACSKEEVNKIKVSISLGWDTKESMDNNIIHVLKNAEDQMYKHKIIQNEGLRGQIITTIIHTLHEKNPREEQHSERVGEIAQSIGKALGLSDIEITKLRTIGRLHDIGKIAIEEGILNKPDALTEQEREDINRHPDIGFRILSASYEMIELAEAILSHHERWDGKGYPRGLAGGEIPFAARIIAVADSYDAMTSERPYRSALSEDVAVEEIKRNAGIQFDPLISRVFVERVLNRSWE